MKKTRKKLFHIRKSSISKVRQWNYFRKGFFAAVDYYNKEFAFEGNEEGYIPWILIPDKIVGRAFYKLQDES